HRPVHDRVRPRTEGEPRRARPPVRLSDARRRELPAPHHRPLARRRPRAVDEAGARHEVAAAGAHLLMRRWPAPALLAVPLVAAACGGGGSSSSPPPTVSNLSPVAYVKGAAVKTAEATSEHVTVKGLAQVSGQTVTLDGSGDFDQQSRVGSMNVDFSAGGINGTIDEVISGTTIYMRSPLLDCLGRVKDRIDGSLAYRKSCRMMICGACGMRMDGAAVLACKQRMFDMAQAGHVPTISAMGNLPIVKDIVVDMVPFWQKFNAMKPYLQPGYDRPDDGREYRIEQGRMNVVHKESLCINCGRCVP